MKKSLHRDEFEHLASDVVGEQTKHNHAECSAGVDTKQRLYVKRTEKGVLAYCHHCGKGGGTYNGDIGSYVKALDQAINGSIPGTAVNLQHDLIPLPTDVDPECNGAPRDILLWLAKSGVTFEELKEHGAGWSDELKGFVMPANGCYQVRYCEQARNKGLPKYLTFRCEQEIFPIYYADTNVPAPAPFCLVFVEDFLSAVKVARTGYTTCWMLGLGQDSILQESVMAFGSHTHYVVMLDNDKPEVKKRACDIKTTLEKFGGKAYIADNPTDPKNMLLVDIQKAIDEALK